MKENKESPLSEGVKALFFAQYLGKPLIVASIPENISYPNYPFDIDEGALFLSGVIGNQIIVRRIAEDVKDRFNQTALLLRSIDQLTDDEFIAISEINGYKLEDWGRDTSNGYNCITRGKKYLSELLYGSGLMCNRAVQIHQYLLRVGILLEFTYLDKNNKPVTIQPDEIISLGWAKYVTP